MDQQSNLPKPIIVKMDGSGFTIASLLNQYNGFSIFRQVNIHRQEHCPYEQNYDTYDRELSAIVETLR